MPAAYDWTLGASEAIALIAGDLPDLWARLTGRAPRYEPPDMGETLAAKIRAQAPHAKVNPLNLELARRMGNALEPLHAAWFEERTSLRITDRQARRSLRPNYPLHATLDGTVRLERWMAQQPMEHWQEAVVPWEAKTVSPHTRLSDLIARYQPQLQAQMLVLNAPCAVFSVLWRSPKWEAVVVPADPILQAEILDRLDLLTFYIEDDSEPRALPPFPVSPGLWRPLVATTGAVQPTSEE